MPGMRAAVLDRYYAQLVATAAYWLQSIWLWRAFVIGAGGLQMMARSAPLAVCLIGGQLGSNAALLSTVARRG